VRVRTTSDPSRAWRLAVAAVVATTLALVMSVVAGPAAHAAAGDYDVEITGPATIPVYDAFNYTVTISTAPADGPPGAGVVLTATLPAGLAVDAVPTGAGSPVESWVEGPGPGEVTFTMKSIDTTLTSFAFSVRQVDNADKFGGMELETTLVGSATPSGDAPDSSVTTVVTGDMLYDPSKTASTVVGSGNRVVTYTFNAWANNNTTTSETFYAHAFRLVDTLPAGAVIQNVAGAGQPGAGAGAWSFTANPDGTTTAEWVSPDGPVPPFGGAGIQPTYGPIWLRVFYPASDFPAGPAPRNTVGLVVEDVNGDVFGPRTAFADSPPFADAPAGTGIHVQKSAGNGTSDSQALASGGWLSYFLTKASFLTDDATDPLASMTVEDSAEGGNGLFFGHADTYALTIVFNDALQGPATVPFQLEYTTSADDTDWKVLAGALTTETSRTVVVQNVGSAGFATGAANQSVLNLPLGERLTGWRVVLSPDDATTIGTGAEVSVTQSFVADWHDLDTGEPGTADGTAIAFVNTSTAAGETVSGSALEADDPTSATIAERVNIITSVSAPSSIEVGASAVYTASINNLDPLGRAYDDTVLRVVLPVGVQYDASVGVTPVSATVPTVGTVVPTVGAGMTVDATGTVTDALGVHQVVELRFDTLESTRTWGEVKHREEINASYRYRIPTQVLPQAFVQGGPSVAVTSWAYTDDARYATLPLAFYFTYFGADVYGFGQTSNDVVARATASSVVTTAGGLLLGKLVRADDGGSWLLDTEVTDAAQWQLYVSNSLPQEFTDVVVFDRLPYVGDGLGSEFAVTVSDAVTGLPAGATVEYSTDATSADTGTWSTEPVGATALRILIDELGSGESLTAVVPTAVPASARFGEQAVNGLVASGSYAGDDYDFDSNTARVSVSALPGIAVVKLTNGIDVTEAPGVPVTAGSTVTWTYEVTNTGNTVLDGIELSDAFVDGAGATGTLTPTSADTGPLEPGGVRVFTATGTAVVGQYVNEVTAVGTPVDGAGDPIEGLPQQEATDESWYIGAAVVTPGGSLESTGQLLGHSPVIGALALLVVLVGAAALLVARRRSAD